jgi:hypothetical protein
MTDDILQCDTMRTVEKITEVGSYDDYGSTPIKIERSEVPVRLICEVIGGDFIVTAISEDAYGDTDMDGFRLENFPSYEKIESEIDLMMDKFKIHFGPRVEQFVKDAFEDAFWAKKGLCL